MKSYFFIPASRLRKLKDIQESTPNYIIIDFEDAILSSHIETYFEELKDIRNVASNWFRIPVRSDFNKDLDLKYIEKFKSIGVNAMVLPKLKSAAELLQVVEKYKTIKFIVLIEHPRLLIEFKSVYLKHPGVFQSVVGVGLGSHDLMAIMNSKHTEKQLDYPRKEVLYLAKAYGLEAIDIASMEIFNKELFVKEVKYGQDNGFDGKFLIHPVQLEWLGKVLMQDSSSLSWAKKVKKSLPENYTGQDIAPFILDGEVIEKPHVLKALEIIKKHNHGK